MGGFFPGGVQFLPALESLTMEYGELEGGIPALTLTKMKQLKSLSVKHNKFRGTLPATLPLAISLRHLDISHNEFQGPLPAALHTMKLETLDVSGNQLTGTISAELGNLSTLTQLRLNGNSFVGSIPTTVCDLMLTALESDCKPSAFGGSEISCSCCTACCDSNGDQCAPV